MQHPQFIPGIHFHALGTQPCKMAFQIRPNPGKVILCFLHGFLVDRYGHIFFLHHVARSRSFGKKHIIVLFSVQV